ncbi:hypothetical protein D9613_010514 [Agrocybe pediades]|uniref:C2H2-type domain-containing protein n=1 Tax=Agrocybe pediades TaxID=84607 RepID=A0A8H4QFY3_9AGAR|nr:hypothetical protein D9613_010514 [Agrocybe pediades]
MPKAQPQRTSGKSRAVANRSPTCDICNKELSRRSDLARHRRTHSDDIEVRQPHVCTLCGTRSSQASNLTAHIQAMHLGEPSFYCGMLGTNKDTGELEICTLLFKTNSTLCHHRNDTVYHSVLKRKANRTTGAAKQPRRTRQKQGDKVVNEVAEQNIALEDGIQTAPSPIPVTSHFPSEVPDVGELSDASQPTDSESEGPITPPPQFNQFLMPGVSTYRMQGPEVRIATVSSIWSPDPPFQRPSSLVELFNNCRLSPAPSNSQFYKSSTEAAQPPVESYFPSYKAAVRANSSAFPPTTQAQTHEVLQDFPSIFKSSISPANMNMLNFTINPNATTLGHLVDANVDPFDTILGGVFPPPVVSPSPQATTQLFNFEAEIPEWVANGGSGNLTDFLQTSFVRTTNTSFPASGAAVQSQLPSRFLLRSSNTFAPAAVAGSQPVYNWQPETFQYPSVQAQFGPPQGGVFMTGYP